MAKLSLALAASLAAGASAFSPVSSVSRQSSLSATGFEEVGGKSWDPMSLGKLGQGEAFDTFPGMFPDYQYLNDSEIKHGRMSMLAWTGIWATHVVSRIDLPLDRCIAFYLVIVPSGSFHCTLPRHLLVAKGSPYRYLNTN